MEIVELLSSKGSFIDITDVSDETVLLKAVRSRRTDDVRKLLTLGADAKCVNRNRESALHLALSVSAGIENGNGQHCCKDVHKILDGCEASDSMLENTWTRSEDEVAILVELLLQNNADCNAVCCGGETALYKACKLQLSSVVKLLLEAGSSVNVTASVKHPLVVACHGGAKDIVEQLLAAGADVNVVPTPALIYGSCVGRGCDTCVPTTPLCTAVKECHVTVVNVLLASGADATMCDRSGKSAVDYVVDQIIKTKDGSQHQEFKALLLSLLESKADVNNNFKVGEDNPLYRACTEGLRDVVEVLLQHGAADSQSSCVAMSAALAVACKNNDDGILELLLAHGAKPTMTVSRLFTGLSVCGASPTLLHSAASRGNARMVVMLIEAGVDVNQTDSNGNTALHAASTAEVADALVRLGADVDALNNKQESPLYAACFNQRQDVVDLLIEHSADPNQSTTAVPLIVACQMNNDKLVKILLDYGADPNISNVHVRTRGKFTSSSRANALCIACENYNDFIVKALVAEDAEVNVVGARGNSALHLAIRGLSRTKAATGMMDLEIIDVLLSKLDSTAINMVNENGKTPLSSAVKKGLHEVVVKLVNSGADVNAGSSDHHPLIVACEICINSTAKLANHMRAVRMAFKKLTKGVAAAAAAAGSDSKENAASGTSNLSTIELLMTHKAAVNVKTRDGRTPLYIAVENELDDVVSLLLEHGAKTQMTTTYRHPLIYACEYGSESIAELLLNWSADVNVSDSNNDGRTPLCVAAGRLSNRLIQRLVECGASVNDGDNDANTPLHYAFKVGMLLRRPGCGHCVSGARQPTSTVGMLLKMGAWVNVLNNEGETPLYLACVSDDKEFKQVKLLLSYGADPNLAAKSKSICSSQGGKSYPLSYAVSQGSLNLVKLLLDGGAQLENAETGGRTPLHLAVEGIKNHNPAVNKVSTRRKGDLAVVEVLLNRGAYVNSLDANGATVLFKACQQNVVHLVSLLLRHGANSNLTTGGKYPLVAACRNENTELVRLLLDHGASANVQLPCNATCSDARVPLCIAARSRNGELMKLLLSHGADVNSTDYDGQTALHLVASCNDASAQRCVDLLLDYEADAHALSKKKETPLYVACATGSIETVKKMLRRCPLVTLEDTKQPLAAVSRQNKLVCVQLLTERGADVNAPSVTSYSIGSPAPDGRQSFELPLCLAADAGNIDIVKHLLDRGAAINKIDSGGNTALQYVVDRLYDFPVESSRRGRYHTLFGMLLERGADVNIVNLNAETVLFKAAVRGLPYVVRQLLKHGANPNLPAVKDYPLSVACRQANAEIVKILLAGGANPNQGSANSAGSLPIFLAASNASVEIMEQLLSSGARIDFPESEVPLKYRSADGGESSLRHFVVPFNSKQEYVIRLFKAGAGMWLLSTCCERERSRSLRSSMSTRLCQALVLAGCRIPHDDLETSAVIHVRDSHHLFKVLSENSRNPPSLMRSCRTAVRRQLSLASGYRTILPLVDCLPIPHQLQLYLKFEGLLSEVDLTMSDNAESMEFGTSDDDDDYEYDGYHFDDNDDEDTDGLYGGSYDSDGIDWNERELFSSCGCRDCRDDSDDDDY